MTQEEARERAAIETLVNVFGGKASISWAEAYQIAKKIYSAGYRLIPDLTVLTDEEREAALRQAGYLVAAQHAGSGDFCTISQAQLAKFLKQIKEGR